MKTLLFSRVVAVSRLPIVNAIASLKTSTRCLSASVLLFLAAGSSASAATATVSPGLNPTVKVKITQPGSVESIAVAPANGWKFSQEPYIANNPQGLWWSSGGNTFSVVFLQGQATSADVTIAGKLVRDGAGGGGGGGAPPPEYDFSLPGIAVLEGNVGAIFELPDEYWWMEGESVSCRVRFFAGTGTVTSAGAETYTWSGDSLGTFSPRAFALQIQTFTYSVGTGSAGKEGQIKGSYVNIKVDNAGSFSTQATSIMQKAFKVEFNALNINKTKEPIYEVDANGNGSLTCTATMWGYLKPTPETSEIPFQLRLVQSCCTYGDNQYKFDGPGSLKMIYSSSLGNFYFDGIGEGTGWDPTEHSFSCRLEDPPRKGVSNKLSTYLSAQRYDNFVVLLQGRKGESASWRTYGQNTWDWHATHTNGAPAVVTKGFNVGSEHGSTSNANTPAMHPDIREAAPLIPVNY